MSGRWLKCALFVAVWGVTAVATLHWVDPDLGWHLASGRYFGAHGIPAHDVFSYTQPSFKWVDHEWLNDVIMWKVYQNGGYVVLALLMALVWTTAIWLGARRRPVVILVLAMGALLPYLTTRPTAWSALLLAVTIRLLVSGRWRWLPPLFLVWANLHGGFIIGLLAVALYIAWCQDRWRYAKWLATCTVVTLINPYGYGVYIEIWRTLSDPTIHSNILEWEPIDLSTLNDIWMLALILCLMARVKVAEGSQLALAAITLVGTILSARNLPLLIIAALPVLEAGWEGLRSGAEKVPWRAKRALAPMATAAVIALLAWSLWPLRTVHADGLSQYLEPAVAQLRSTPCNGRLLNSFDYGGYIDWRLPSVPVYIDGRMPSWPNGSSTSLKSFVEMLKDPAQQAAALNRYNIKCALISDSKEYKTLHENLQSAGWKTTYNHRRVVLLRHDNR